MTQILIVTDTTEGGGEVVYRERVDAIHLASEHSRRQLAERLAWGVGDASLAERRRAAAQPLRPSPPLPSTSSPRLRSRKDRSESEWTSASARS
jgi:hypothetical protein